MTLLQILARELKDWPVELSVMNPEDDKCCMSDEDSEVYFGMGHTFAASRRADSTRGVYVCRPQWQAARAEYLKSVEAMPWPDDATHYVPAQMAIENDVFYRVVGGASVASWAVRLSGGVVESQTSPANNMRHLLPGTVERSCLLRVGAKAVAVLADDCRAGSMTGWQDGDELECVGHYSVNRDGNLFPVFVNLRVFGFSTLRPDCYKLVDDHASEAVKRICSDLDVDPEVARRILDKGYKKEAEA